MRPARKCGREKKTHNGPNRNPKQTARTQPQRGRKGLRMGTGPGPPRDVATDDPANDQEANQHGSTLGGSAAARQLHQWNVRAPPGKVADLGTGRKFGRFKLRAYTFRPCIV